MRVERLILQNYRCFEEKEISFPGQISLLCGDNASGKTAVLDALDVAMSTWTLGFALPGIEYRRAIAESDVRLKEIILGQIQTYEPDYPVSMIAEGMVQNQYLVWARKLLLPGGKTTYGDAKDLIELAKTVAEQIKSAATGQNVILPVLAYYGTQRLWKQKKEKFKNPVGFG